MLMNVATLLIVCRVAVLTASSHQLLPFNLTDLQQLSDGKELTQRGLAALTLGNAELAVRLFTAAAAYFSHDGATFNNLATSLATLGVERQDNELLCESHAAAQLAVIKGYSGAKELAVAIEDAILRRPCRHELVNHSVAEHIVAGSLSKNEHLQLVSRLCAAPRKVTLEPTGRESQLKLWTCTHLYEAWMLMRICGVVAVTSLIDTDLIASVAQAQAQHAEDVVHPIRTSFESVEAASRGFARKEVKLPLKEPFTHPDLCAGKLLRSLLKLLLGERIELDTFSYIDSAPGSLDQDWHNDVPTPSEANGKMPLFGVVAVTPLTNLTSFNGATEFLTGSHIDMGDQRFWMLDEAGGATRATPHLQVEAEVGSVVLFDIRLRHRGRANSANRHRPVLYSSYVQEWFRDAVNFQDAQTREWDELPTSTRKLFARLDTRRYIYQLEKELEKRGLMITQVRSSSKYQQRSFEL